MLWMQNDLMELREATLQLLARMFTQHPFCRPFAAAARLAAGAEGSGSGGGGGGSGGGGATWVAQRVKIDASGMVPGLGEPAARVRA
jgi:hypothetical protein